MPTLRYVGNAGRYRLTNSDVDVAQGETVEVDAETAEYLQEHGEFEVVDGDGSTDTTYEGRDVEEIGDEVIADTLDDGECPWCHDYEGDAVGQHAASAHPDAWDDYKED